MNPANTRPYRSKFKVCFLKNFRDGLYFVREIISQHGVCSFAEIEFDSGFSRSISCQHEIYKKKS